MKKATLYSYLDLMIPALIAIILFIFMNTFVSYDRSKIENRIVEASDSVAASMDLVSLLKLQSPVDDLTYAELFIHMENNRIEKPQLDALNKGLEEFFSHYSKWNLRVVSQGDVKHNYGNMPNNPVTYRAQLPGNEQYVELYLSE